MSNNIDVQPEVIAAEEEVRRARAALVNDLHAISATGKRAITRAVRKSRPLVIGACVVGGVVVVVGLTRLLRPRRRPIFSLAKPPGLVSIVARAALSSLVRAVAVRVAERVSVQVGEAALRLPHRDVESAHPATETAAPPRSPSDVTG